MTKGRVAVLSEREPARPPAPYPASTCTARGNARGVSFYPQGFSLWRIVGELSPGDELEWGTAHGEEGIYIVDGALEHKGDRAEAGSGILIEAGTPTVVRACTDTRLVHFGCLGDGPTGGGLRPKPEPGHQVHVVTPEQAEVIAAPGYPVATFFADGSDCPSCGIAMFTIDGRAIEGEYVASSHVHSEDEIIHVTEGELKVGSLRVSSGMSIAVPSSLRYGFRTSGPFRFINYRPDLSTYLGSPGTEPILETVATLRNFRSTQDMGH